MTRLVSATCIGVACFAGLLVLVGACFVGLPVWVGLFCRSSSVGGPVLQVFQCGWACFAGLPVWVGLFCRSYDVGGAHFATGSLSQHP